MYDSKGTTLKEAAQYLGEATNNYAEYAAVVLGLEMIAKYFGVTVEELIPKVMHAIDNPTDPERVETGPCQEVVLEGEDVDLDRIPMLFPCAQDGGNFISSGVVGVGFIMLRAYKLKLQHKLERERLRRAEPPENDEVLDQLELIEAQLDRLEARQDFTERLLNKGDEVPR